MSVVETFYLLIKGDTTQLKKAAQESKKLSGDMEKNFKGMSSEINKSLAAVTRSLVNMAAAFISVGSVVAGFGKSYDYALGLSHSSQALNLNVAALDVWGRAVEKFGGNADSFGKSISALGKHANFLNKDVLKLLPMLADSFKKAGIEKATALGTEYGLDPSLILLLSQGRKGLEEIIKKQKELGYVTQEDADAARHFNSEWQDTKTIFSNLFTQLNTEGLPVLGSLLDKMQTFGKFLTRHKDLVKGFGLAISTGLAVAAFAFFGWGTLIAAGVALAIGLIALLYDDLSNFAKGNDSLTGDLMKRWPLVGAVMKGAFNGVVAILKFTLDLIERTIDAMVRLSQVGGKFIVREINTRLGLELGKAQQTIVVANKNPIASQTSNSISHSSNSAYNFNNNGREVTVNLGDVTIEANGGDAQQIAGAYENYFTDQMRKATSALADGRTI